jgi:ribosomal-protein-alanine N-acetyltransferase
MTRSEGSAESHRGLGIEPVQPGDVAAIHALQRQLMADPWSSESSRSELAHPDALGWIARRGDSVAGFLLGRKVPGKLEVMAMGVAPDLRRQGIGRALLERAATAARASDCAALVLELRASNVAARALYEAAGFVVAGRRPRYYPGGEDALLMNLQLE